MTNIPLADKERARAEQHRPHSALPAGDAAPESGNGKEPGGDQTLIWGDPDFALLDDRRGDLPEFPISAFHGLCRHWVEGAAHAAGVTPSHVALPLLGVASSLIGTARRVRATKSWSQPMTLWTALIGHSGSGKSPAIDTMKNAISHIERDRAHRIAALKHAHEERAAAAKAAQRKWRDAVVSAVKDGRVPPSMPIEAMVPDDFVAPRLFVSNATIERLAVLLQVRPRGCLYLADELAALFGNMGRYSRGRDDQFWLEAWTGGRYVVERMDREPVVIENLLIGLVGGFQPDALARAFRGDSTGMYSRFLFAWPAEPTYRPLSSARDEIDPDIVHALTRLVDLPAEEDGQLLDGSVPLSPSALAAFEIFRQAIFEARAEFDGRDREYLAKAPGQTLRLAGALAFLNWAFSGGAEPDCIAEEYVTTAAALWENYFWRHARSALRLICVDRYADARRVLKWLQARHRHEVSREDVRVAALGRRLDAGQTQAVLDALVKGGWLREAIKPTAGRSAHRWHVNPVLMSSPQRPRSPER